ncbi:hypothetical protein BAE44_0022780 [Dichanthelium oligosanthes]|uniref:PGG domain-containing protein n=1 Tax=Dichanthelium oligosanthes TaxID=888268 RepID=A0A1E5UTG9_9POAL|nr:hypothetical protein BAE44_0022780 [Dichanthelium oligosanthes]
MADKVKEPAPLAVSMDKESSSRLPVPSVDKKQLLPLFAVLVDMKPSPPPPVPSIDKKEEKKKKPYVVLLVCLWALFNAVIFSGFSISTLIMNRNPCTKSTWWVRCVELTDAAAAEASALVRGQLWCSAPQAAAAALALLLITGRRRRWSRSRWALALVALASTAASHYMEVMADRIFLAAAPGDAGFVTNVVLAYVLVLLDLLVFLCLLLLGDGEE